MRDIDIIKLRTEEIFGIKDISIKNKADEYILARAAYYFVAKKKTNRTLGEIGNLVNKDHACVLHALSKMEEYDISFKGFKRNRLLLMGMNIRPFDVLYNLIAEVSINEIEDVISAVKSVIDDGVLQQKIIN